MLFVHDPGFWLSITLRTAERFVWYGTPSRNGAPLVAVIRDASSGVTASLPKTENAASRQLGRMRNAKLPVLGQVTCVKAQASRVKRWLMTANERGRLGTSAE